MSLVSLIVFSLLSVSADANDQSKRDFACPEKSVQQATKDVITLSIKEIRFTRQFVNSIPQLKSVQENESRQLLDCVVGLIDCLSDIRSILTRLRHLKAKFLDSDTTFLKGMVSRVQGFNQVCNLASNDVDGTILTMLDQKLVDIAMLINNVVNKVSKFELGTAAILNP